MGKQSGNSGMGSGKHRKSGWSSKSPRFRFKQKMEAEKTSIQDKSRIKDPRQSVSDLFHKGK